MTTNWTSGSGDASYGSCRERKASSTRPILCTNSCAASASFLPRYVGARCGDGPLLAERLQMIGGMRGAMVAGDETSEPRP
jgi:hypothetical protein